MLNSHSITLLIGPTGCGKTFLSNILRSKGALILSSDNFRSQFSLLPPSSNSPAHQEVSSQAFGLLFAYLEAASSFPVSANVPYIVVDTTGLNESFRQKIAEVARRNNYRLNVIVFAFTDKKNYYTHSGHRDRSLVERHVTTLFRKVLPTLKKSDYDQLIRIKSPEDIYSDAVQLEFYSPKVLNNAFIIGDVHECVEELEELLSLAPKEATPVLVGDYLDKGGNTEGILKFLQANPKIVLVDANHENYVEKALSGQLKSRDTELEEKYFTSLPILTERGDLLKIFLDLRCNRTVPFVKLEAPNTSTGYITHVPTEDKYLGKTDAASLKAQRNFRYEKEYIVQPRPHNSVLRFCGHIPHLSSRVDYFNTYFLDGGVASGGRLVGAHYSSKGVELYSVKSRRQFIPESFSVVKTPEKQRVVTDPRDLRFLSKFLSTKVRALSPTIAPAPSKELDIESLEAGLKLFPPDCEVRIEPKYMGSRAQVYFTKDEAYVASRNGFIIKQTPEIQEALKRLRSEVEANVPYESILVLDCELLPWSVLGGGLIQDTFHTYHAAVKFELDMLREAGFPQPENEEKLLGFQTQLAIHGEGGDPQFEPFGVLMVDGEVSLNNSYAQVGNKVLSRVIKAEEVESAQAFFDLLAKTYGLEGVVIKPMVRSETLPPAIKVRNKEYLRLIYGHDYDMESRLPGLCRDKRIGGKLRISQREYSLQDRMLVAKSPEELLNLAEEFLGELRREEGLDSRL